MRLLDITVWRVEKSFDEVLKCPEETYFLEKSYRLTDEKEGQEILNSFIKEYGSPYEIYEVRDDYLNWLIKVYKFRRSGCEIHLDFCYEIDKEKKTATRRPKKKKGK